MTIPTLAAPDRRTSPDRRETAKAKAAALVIHQAVEHSELEVLFQPQFAASDGRVLGAEALARWRHPERDLLGASELFELAEQAGRTSQVTRHITAMALAAAASWPASLKLSVNVTAADLRTSDFAESIAQQLDEASFSPERLVLEITEQSLVAELEGSAVALESLARKGIRVALDDFGAGFCNFGYLKRLPLNTIKLDRSMIVGIGEDARDLAVLRGIVDMAQALGLDVIAEGIETEDQRAIVVREGCTGWQGFLGAKPMTAGEFNTLVKRPPAPFLLTS